MPKTIKEATIVELKAEAYDALARIELAQSYLKAINQELELRAKTPVTNEEINKEAETK